MKQVFFGTIAPYLEQELIHTIQSIRSVNAWIPIILLVKTNMMKNDIIEILCSNHISCLNLKIYTMQEWSENLCLCYSQKQYHLISSTLEKFLLQLVIDETISDSGYLGKAKRMKGFSYTLQSLIDEFKIANISIDDLEKWNQEKNKQLLLELIAIIKQYEEYKTENLIVDQQDVFHIASQIVKHISEFKDIPLLLYGFYELSPLEKQLIHNYPASTYAFIPYYYNSLYSIVSSLVYWFKAEAFNITSNYITPENYSLTHKRIIEKLFSHESLNTIEDESIECITTENKNQEMTEIIKYISVLQKENIPLSQICIIEEQLEKYYLYWRDLFQLANIPYNVPFMIPIATQEANLFLLLIQLGNAKNPWKILKQILQSSVLSSELFESSFDFFDWNYIATYYQWDSKSNMLSFLDDLDSMLGHIQEKQNIIIDLDSERNLLPWEQKADYWKNSIEKFKKVLDYFIKQEKSWNEQEPFSKILVCFSELCLPSENKEKIIQISKELYYFDELLHCNSLEMLYDIAKELMSQPVMLECTEHNAVLLTNLKNGYALNKKYVFMTGMAESQFPNMQMQSLLLTKEDRKDLQSFLNAREKEGLETFDFQDKKQKLLYHLSLVNATKKISLWYSQYDIETNKEQIPSLYLLNLWETLLGHSIALNEFPHNTSIYANKKEYALTLLEYDLLLAQNQYNKNVRTLLLEEYPVFAQAYYNSQIQKKKYFTEFDGIIPIQEYPHILQSLRKRSWKCSQIEDYFTCPYLFYNMYILGIQPLEYQSENAKDKYKIPRYEYKKLFLTKLKGQDYLQSHVSTEDYPELIQEIAKERIDELAEQFMEKKDCDTIISFPYSIDLDYIHIEGKLDQIYRTSFDCNGNQYFFVSNSTEKKTSIPKDQEKFWTIAANERFQAHIEFLALKRTFTPQSIQMSFYSIRDNYKQKKNILIELSASNEEKLYNICEQWKNGIEKGIFIAHPQGKCDFCPYQSICGTNKKILFQQKKEDHCIDFLKNLKIL